MPSRLINLLVILLILMLGVNIFRSWINLSRKSEIIKQTQEKLEEVRQQHEDFKRQLYRVESQEFVEKEARDKLNLAKEKELVVILPSISPILTPIPVSLDTSANWQRWVKMFW